MLNVVGFAVVFVDMDEIPVIRQYATPFVAVIAAIAHLKADPDTFGVDGIFPVVEFDLGPAIEHPIHGAALV